MGILNRFFGVDLYRAVYRVDSIHHGLRLDRFLQTEISSFSREQIKKKICMGEVLILGRLIKCRPNTRVCSGDKVVLEIPETIHEEEWWKGKRLELERIPTILYEDQAVIGVSKPPYMSTHPTGKHLFNCVTVYFQHHLSQQVYSVHRLDRETSGVLLLAKNPHMAALLTAAFEQNQIRKSYFFIAQTQKEYQGELELIADQRLGSLTTRGLERVYIHDYPENSSYGKTAETLFRIIHREKGYILGLAFPQTGRQHQIRVHAKAHGFPLLGDKLYLGSFKLFQRFKDGKATSCDHALMELPRHALHAGALNFPYKGKRKTIICPLPKDLKEWMLARLTLDCSEFESLLFKEIDRYFVESER